MVRTFNEMHAFTFARLKNKNDFPSLEDEIAQPRPDMIKVAALTVSEKSINKGNNSL